MDYLFAIDADMMFVGDFGHEIFCLDLGSGFTPRFSQGQRGGWNPNQYLSSYVNPHEGKHYYAGGVYGGKLTSIE